MELTVGVDGQLSLGGMRDTFPEGVNRKASDSFTLRTKDLVHCAF